MTTPLTTEPPIGVTGSTPMKPTVCYAEETNEGDKGLIEWPETDPAETVSRECPYQKSIGDTTYAIREWYVPLQ